MPKLKQFEVILQMKNSTMWNQLAALIPKNDELREEAFKMGEYSNTVYSTGECFTGTSTYEDSDGEYEMDSSLLWREYDVVDTEDKGFQKYCDDQLALLESLEKKYKDKPEHRLMMTYIDYIKLGTENLKKGVALNTNVAQALISGNADLTKMKDVLMDVEPENRRESPDKNVYKDSTVYESTAKEFGITSLYEEYNATLKNGVAWQMEWQNGAPDPDKLESIYGKIRENIGNLDNKIKEFERQYVKDAKLPDKERKIYNITNHKDVEQRDLIATGDDWKIPGVRAVNGINWENNKIDFEQRCEKELLAARLMKLQKELGNRGSSSLQKNTKKLIDDCLMGRTRDTLHEVKPLAADHKDAHYELLDAVRYEASVLAQKDPKMKELVAAVDRYKSNPTVQKAEVRHADKWIESLQRRENLEKVGKNGKTSIDTDQFAKIMAARMLAESVRGSKKSLTGKSLNVIDIEKKAEELKKNDSYQGFLSNLKKDPKMMQKAITAARSGHGGGLDDMFKSYLKQLPARQLSNNPLLARYMPTVKERIEALQAQVPQQMDKLYPIVAEIFVLRNLAHAERGKASSLDKPIPTSREKPLQDDIRDLCQNQELHRIVEFGEGRQNTAAWITEGHGGGMVEEFRSRMLERRNWTDKAVLVIKENTFEGRLDELRNQASKLREDVTKNGETEGYRQQACALLGEYIVLDSMTRNPKTKELNQNKMKTDIPWSKVQKNVDKNFTKNPEFEKIAKSMEKELLTTVLDDMASKKQGPFVDDVRKQILTIMQKEQKLARTPKPVVKDIQKTKSQDTELGGR